jgi:hypothetical protein
MKVTKEYSVGELKPSASHAADGRRIRIGIQCLNGFCGTSMLLDVWLCDFNHLLWSDEEDECGAPARYLITIRGGHNHARVMSITMVIAVIAPM